MLKRLNWFSANSNPVLVCGWLINFHPYVSDLHLPSRFITRSEMSLPTASAAARPIRNEGDAISSGLRLEFATTSLTARRTRPYLTILTELPNRYEARGAISGRLKKHDIGTNLRPTARRLPPRATSIREPRLVPARVRFESVSSHIYAPQTHLDLSTCRHRPLSNCMPWA